ncbi:MAG TPA: acylphosphatase [Pseudonocardiaceae bacterium]|nr:acylphosphatase [Pseudonocardiaceae bacterium]
MDTHQVDGRVRVRARVEGVVQGVGFRPFVYALAGEYALAGLVGNDVHGVFSRSRAWRGQAAIELEQHTDPTERGTYPAGIAERDGLFLLSGTDLINATAADLLAGVPVPIAAGRFHNGVADAIVRTCDRIAAATDVRTVALSGGVFQNLLLSGRTVDLLTAHGFHVLTHMAVPCNDGGISLGQVAVAAAADYG